MNCIVLRAVGVEGIGEKSLVGAYPENAESEVVVTLSKDIQVEKDLLIGLDAPGLPAVDGILFPFLRARVIVELPELDRGGGVGLLHPADHLIVELLPNSLQMGSHALGILVLGV